jgi:ACR3 family arsenite transporter
LIFFARLGPWVLASGLVIGIAVPELGAVIRPWLPQMVVLLLFLASLRIGFAEMAGSVRALLQAGGMVLVFQLLCPLGVVMVGYVFGVVDQTWLVALVIMMAASSIVGSPNMALMMGHAPDTAMRMLVVGTAMLPLTVIPVFLLMPSLGGATVIVWAAVKLLLVILGSTLAAMAARKWVLRDMGDMGRRRLDGVSAIVLAVFVIGLTQAAGETLRAAPVTMLWWLGFVCLANFGTQIVCFFTVRGRVETGAAVGVSLVAGNRNVALFLVSLPAEVTAPLLIFIGCYQIPMFLTPLVLGRLYKTE